MITHQDGLLKLTLPAAAGVPALGLTGVQAGLQRAGESLSLSSMWRVTDSRSVEGGDACGRYSGFHLRFDDHTGLQVDWQAVTYDYQPVATFAIDVTNTSGQDVRLERLVPLACDPRLGGRIETPLHAERALLINNGLWMDTPQDCWRVPVPEGEPFEAYWSSGLGEEGGPALVAGIGEAANTSASIGALRLGGTLGLILSGWLWADTHRRPLRLPAGRTFAMRRMLVCSASNLHEGLIGYAEFVRRYMGLSLRFPPYAGIFAAYGGDPAGEHPELHPLTEARVESLRRVVDHYLQPYGLDTFKTQFAGLSSGPPGMVGQRSAWTEKDVAPEPEGLVEHVYQSGFTPDVYDSRTDFPHGIEAHVRDLKRRGYRPALVCRPFLNVRSGGTELDNRAADLFEMAVRRWGYDYLMLDFNSDDYETVDDTHTVAQGIRSRFQAIRDRVGPGVFIEACMVMPGPVLGIADGFRHANDWRGGTEPSLARQACTRYYYHGRWFQLDHEFFDPQRSAFTWVTQGVEGMLASLDRVRLWTSFGALTGFSWLTGGVIENVSPERWGIFTRGLPVYGPCARPVDLLRGDPPCIWSLGSQCAGQVYQAMGVFNWHEQPLSLTLRPADFGLATDGLFIFYDFWDQSVFGPAQQIHLNLPPCSCKVLYLHPLREGAFWLGGDRHVTGAIGLERLLVTTDAIAGECAGPADALQCHYFYLPDGVAPVTTEGAEFEVSQYRVLRVTVNIGSTGRNAWRVALRRGSRVL